MKKESLPVAFRVYRENDIIAIFPTIPGTYSVGTCQSYMHIGQHGHVNLRINLLVTKPATPEQYAELQKELVSIGYDNLRVIQKPGDHRYTEKRREALKR